MRCTIEGATLARRALDQMGQGGQNELFELPGGASTRQFFRARITDGSVVIMVTPLPDQSITESKQVVGNATFCEVAQLLRAAGISVPKILLEAHELGVLVVEDLGDQTLDRHLSEREGDKEELYKSVVTDLARLQRKHVLAANSCVRQRAFDEDLLLWEVNHFRDWALEARDIRLSSDESRAFEEAASYLARTIASWPRGFVHRDLQSRNLMVEPREGNGWKVSWIDFQDAMLGPRVYDLVALLNDSYQSLSDGFVQERLREFSMALGCDDDVLRFEFDLVTVQRKLKDAGRFVYFEKTQGNREYLRFVQPTLRTVENALSRLEKVRQLSGLTALVERARALDHERSDIVPGSAAGQRRKRATSLRN